MLKSKLKIFSGEPSEVEVNFNNWKAIISDKQILRIHENTTVIDGKVCVVLFAFYKED